MTRRIRRLGDTLPRKLHDGHDDTMFTMIDRRPRHLTTASRGSRRSRRWGKGLCRAGTSCSSCHRAHREVTVAACGIVTTLGTISARVKKTGPQWIVGGAEAGVRLDKFLAAPERLGSRGKAVAALERGKVFVGSKRRTSLMLRGAWCLATSCASGPTARQREATAAHGSLGRPRHRLRRRRAAGRQQAAGHPVGPARAQPGRSVRLRPDRAATPLARQAAAVCRPSHRSGHVGARRVRQGPGVAAAVEGAVRATSARAHISGRGLRASIAAGRHMARRARVGHEGVDPEGDSPKRPQRTEAIAEYRVVESFKDTSLIEVRLRTGRRNQIRLQSRLRGHTLVGEQRYVYGPDTLRPIPFGRQALHAYRLEFEHPQDGRALAFEAPLPPDLVDLLTRLRRARD